MDEWIVKWIDKWMKRRVDALVGGVILRVMDSGKMDRWMNKRRIDGDTLDSGQKQITPPLPLFILSFSFYDKRDKRKLLKSCSVEIVTSTKEVLKWSQKVCLASSIIHVFQQFIGRYQSLRQVSREQNSQSTQSLSLPVSRTIKKKTSHFVSHSANDH